MAERIGEPQLPGSVSKDTRPIEESTIDSIRTFWDSDASTYDSWSGHVAKSGEELGTWRAALSRMLPALPARVLDVGAGTGFLSLLAAELGHAVTALDISKEMLSRLEAKAAGAGLDVTCVHGRAERPPAGPFDVVIERHLLWTLPGPVEALRAWRRAVPNGRVILVESLWGPAGGPVEQFRRQAQHLLLRARGAPSEHHGAYPPHVTEQLPLAAGTPPDELVRLVSEAGWQAPRVSRLRDVEWATRRALPFPDRLLGVSARFVVVGFSRPERSD